ncbi:MAG: hypothetical protein HY286_09540 [Planctomycetes bacterium]|nr:hypothetical protein [Planctomycetota bacterium]
MSATSNLLLFLICVVPAAVARGGDDDKINFTSGSHEKAMADAKAEKRQLAILISIDSDVYCAALRNKTLSNPAVAAQFNKIARAHVADPRHGDGKDLINKFNVTILPTMLFLDSASGEEIDRICGFLTDTEFLKYLKTIADGDSFAALQKKAQGGSADPQVWFQYASKLEGRDDVANAKSAWKKLLEIDANDKNGYYSLAEYHLLVFECQESQDYHKLLDLAKKYKGKPAALEAHTSMVKFLVARLGDGGEPGDLEQVIDSYEYLLANGRKTVRTLNQYAWLLATRNKNLDRALAVALEANALEPKSAEIADTVAECYLLQQKLDLALEWEKKAVAYSKDDNEKVPYEIKARHFADELSKAPASKPAK